jgi:crooked neck
MGDELKVEYVKAKLPKRVKKRRKVNVVNQETGKEVTDTAEWEEYYELMFPDDEEKKRNMKIIAMAHKWKEQGAAK